MDNMIAQLLERIRELEQQLEQELERRRLKFGVILDEKRICFNAELVRYHLQARRGLLAYLRRARLVVVLSAPFIYALLLPLVLLDLLLFLYQAVCFPIYGIDRVPRREYILVDRGALAYLNAIEKVNCLYCGYATGLLAMAREVAARTERHWCPIKHARRIRDPHANYFDFAEFGDPEGYRQRVETIRQQNCDKEKGSPPDAS